MIDFADESFGIGHQLDSMVPSSSRREIVKQCLREDVFKLLIPPRDPMSSFLLGVASVCFGKPLRNIPLNSACLHAAVLLPSVTNLE